MNEIYQKHNNICRMYYLTNDKKALEWSTKSGDQWYHGRRKKNLETVWNTNNGLSQWNRRKSE